MNKTLALEIITCDGTEHTMPSKGLDIIIRHHGDSSWAIATAINHSGIVHIHNSGFSYIMVKNDEWCLIS